MTWYVFTCGHRTQAKPMFVHCHVWSCRGVLIGPVTCPQVHLKAGPEWRSVGI